jgi:DNA-binding MarR family transcriptional regulator
MSIEKDINQTKFRDEWHKASVNIIFTSNWVLEQQKKHFDRANLTSQQYNMLRILKGSTAPLSTLQIRERMLDKMSDTSRIVDRLVAKELVKKEINKADKRLVDVTISPKGRELIDWMDHYAYEIDDVLKNLSEEEAHQLNFLLDKARERTE